MTSTASGGNETIPTPEGAVSDYRERMRRPLTSSPTLLVAGVALAALLTGCGRDEGPTPVSETLPACDDIWVAGETIPEDYEGCRDEDGVLQVSEIKECTKSDDRFTTFGEEFYGLLGGAIRDDGLSSPSYDELYAGCFGTDW